THDQRHLAHGEENGDGHDTPDLEGHPEVSREPAPDDLVGDGEKYEEQPPAQGQFAPTFRIQLEGGIEDIAQERFPESQTAKKNHREQGIDDGGLHLDEGFVLQVKRQSAENKDDDARYERHDRQGTRQYP